MVGTCTLGFHAQLIVLRVRIPASATVQDQSTVLSLYLNSLNGHISGFYSQTKKVKTTLYSMINIATVEMHHVKPQVLFIITTRKYM